MTNSKKYFERFFKRKKMNFFTKSLFREKIQKQFRKNFRYKKIPIHVFENFDLKIYFKKKVTKVK